jgi:hypothetical protein
MATITDIINEKSTGYISVAFFNKDGDAAIPSAVSYRIDDVITGDEIKDDTVVSFPAAVINIVIASSENIIVSPTAEVLYYSEDGKPLEKHRLTVKSSYGVDDSLNDEFDFYVKNLSGVS